MRPIFARLPGGACACDGGKPPLRAVRSILACRVQMRRRQVRHGQRRPCDRVLTEFPDDPVGNGARREEHRMSYLVPSEFVTKMVDAGESKVFMSTRDTVIRAYM